MLPEDDVTFVRGLTKYLKLTAKYNWNLKGTLHGFIGSKVKNIYPPKNLKNLVPSAYYSKYLY